MTTTRKATGTWSTRHSQAARGRDTAPSPEQTSPRHCILLRTTSQSRQRCSITARPALYTVRPPVSRSGRASTGALRPRRQVTACRGTALGRHQRSHSCCGGRLHRMDGIIYRHQVAQLHSDVYKLQQHDLDHAPRHPTIQCGNCCKTTYPTLSAVIWAANLFLPMARRQYW